MTTLMVTGIQAENFPYWDGRYGIFSHFHCRFDFQFDRTVSELPCKGAKNNLFNTMARCEHSQKMYACHRCGSMAVTTRVTSVSWEGACSFSSEWEGPKQESHKAAVQSKCTVSYMCNFTFSSSQFEKKSKKQTGEINLKYYHFNSQSILKITERVYISFFCTKFSKI